MNAKYLVMITAAIVISTTVLASLAYADVYVPEQVNIYTWTDKTHYKPGEKVVLDIVFRNDWQGDDKDLIIRNITILYPWFGFTGEEWEGNETIVLTDEVVEHKGGVYTDSIEFTIPTDGRLGWAGSQVNLVITVDKDLWDQNAPYGYSRNVGLNIDSTPWFMSFEDMEKIVTLFTVQTVLIIVCTIIIAASIFLSGRRPKVTWREPEKA